MLNLFINAAKKVIIEYNNAKENIREQQKKAPPIIISLFTKRLLEDLLFVIEKISSIRFSKDFKACIMECEVRDYKTTVSSYTFFFTIFNFILCNLRKNVYEMI